MRTGKTAANSWLTEVSATNRLSAVIPADNILLTIIYEFIIINLTSWAKQVT
jgi:hypothetical protein